MALKHWHHSIPFNVPSVSDAAPVRALPHIFNGHHVDKIAVRAARPFAVTNTKRPWPRVLPPCRPCGVRLHDSCSLGKHIHLCRIWSALICRTIIIRCSPAQTDGRRLNATPESFCPIPKAKWLDSMRLTTKCWPSYISNHRLPKSRSWRRYSLAPNDNSELILNTRCPGTGTS